MRIALEVPAGEKCNGCMFLSIGESYDKPRCALFGYIILKCHRKNGELFHIWKCEQCPKMEVRAGE